MTEDFCTYFDHRYVAKALTMWKSLKAHCPTATLHALCLNEASRQILAELHLPGVHLHSLAELESADPELPVARRNRSLIEYYFTLTPCLPLHIFRTRPEVPRLTYVDADLFFFADPFPIFHELGDNAVGLVEHRFPSNLAHLEVYGRFNVGWMTFRNDPIAVACLNSWRLQCLAWCHDRLEEDRFAEQKYLDEWPTRFNRVAIIQHPGANVAPWNIGRYEILVADGELRVESDPILFFHAHGFEPAGPGRPRDLNLAKYGVRENPVLLNQIFEPYEKALLEATRQLALPLTLVLLSDRSRETIARVEMLETSAKRLHELLSRSEADRAARLEAIQTLAHQLDASEADRAARLEAIQTLAHQLDASEADRAARLDVIHGLQRQLEARDTRLTDVERALANSQTELESARVQLQHAIARIDVMERSRSWRWTQPVRSFGGLVRRRVH
jgi:hypothetical protein